MPKSTEVPPPLPPAVFTALVNADGTLVNEDIYVTKEYVASRLDAPDFTLVDVRTDTEFTGAETIDASRPGHIPGAISFPYTDCYNSDKTVLNFNDLKQLFESKGITATKEVVAYSTVGKRSSFFYFLSRLMGYTNITNYDGSIKEWSGSDPVLYPMVTGPL
jgi:thiosulfate/3-mercaptopyruvate sulfurtransferase